MQNISQALPEVLAAYEVERSVEQEASYVSRALAGTLAGTASAYLMMALGVDTYIHEAWGHVLLGVEPTAEGAHPEITVIAFDQYKALENESDAGVKVSKFFDIFWKTMTEPGLKGEMNPNYEYEFDGTQWHVKHTELGKSLGDDGSSAWVSLAGSLPGLAMSTAAIFAGFQLKDKNPALGYALMTCGTVSWAKNIEYPASAISIIANGTKASASPGHDFIHTAECLSRMTGADELTMAISVFGLFALLPAAVIGGSILYKKAHATDAIEDEAALLYLLSLKEDAKSDPALSELKQRFTTIYDNYPRKVDLENAALTLEGNFKSYEANKVSAEQVTMSQQLLSNEAHQFEQYMLENIPQDDLKAAKKEILKTSKATVIPQTKEQKVVTGIAIGANVLKTASLIMTFINSMVIHSAPLTTALDVLFPIGSSICVILAGYSTYQILTSKSTAVTPNAKILAVAEIVMTVALEALFMAAYFTPGINGVVMPIYIIGKILTLGIAAGKNHEIQEMTDMEKSIEPRHWNRMQKRLQLSRAQQIAYEQEEQERKKRATTIKAKFKYYTSHAENELVRRHTYSRQKKLNNWASLQKKAHKLKRISQEQYDKVK